MGELWGIYKHGLVFLPVAGSLIKKRTLPPTNTSLGNDSKVTMLLQILKSEIMKCWPILTSLFFQRIFWGQYVFQVFLSLLSFAAAMTWVPCCVLGWVAGKWEQCSLLWKFWSMWSVSCGVQWQFAKDGFSPLKHELTFHFSHFLSSFLSYLLTSLFVKAWVLVTFIHTKFTLSWNMAILSTKWASSLWMSVLLEDWR